MLKLKLSKICAYTGQKLAQLGGKIAQARWPCWPLFASLMKGGSSFGRNGWKWGFSPKNSLKNRFSEWHNSGSTDFGACLDPNFRNVRNIISERKYIKIHFNMFWVVGTYICKIIWPISMPCWPDFCYQPDFGWTVSPFGWTATASVTQGLSWLNWSG